jgi:hypothetical protein
MSKALRTFFGLGRVRETSPEEQATATLNLRMQRMLAAHTQADINPQPLPKTEKTA